MTETTLEDKLVGLLSANLYKFTTSLMVVRRINGEVSSPVDSILKRFRQRISEQTTSMNNSDWVEVERFYEKKSTDTQSTPSILRDYTNAYVLSGRVPSFIREMSLEYLVTSFEALLADDIEGILRLMPQMMKTREKSVTYENLLDFKDVSDLMDHVIGREILTLTGGGIEDFKTYFKSKMKIDMSGTNWDEFVEYFLRRNLLIHNDLRPNLAYIKKTGYKGGNDRLQITEDYLTKGFDLFERYAEDITIRIHSKFCKNRQLTRTEMVIFLPPSRIRAIMSEFTDSGTLSNQ